MKKPNRIALGTLAGLVWAGWPPVADARTRHQAAAQPQARERNSPAQSHQGRRAAAGDHVQKGTASIYADSLRGRKMADGTHFNPGSDAAASKTLPLGTTARVTNLDNGRTATVRVRDRGPHKPGRIIDVSPGSADALGMKQDGLAPVAVAPGPDTSAK
ncbi:MAG TPA: septal ring lytic transglycosylase RlpA family protein [Acetobacteraceae bacterium]